jgi:hypothetical protein
VAVQTCAEEAIEEQTATIRNFIVQDLNSSVDILDFTGNSATVDFIETCGQNTIPALVRLLETDQDYKVFEATAMALSRVGELEKLEMVIKSSNLMIRYFAIQALAQISNRNPLALEILDNNQVEVIETLDRYERYIEDDGLKRNSDSEIQTAAARSTGDGTRGQLPEKPIACSINWIAKYWNRCR